LTVLRNMFPWQSAWQLDIRDLTQCSTPSVKDRYMDR
jgi:hypothetical protein